MAYGPRARHPSELAPFNPHREPRTAPGVFTTGRLFQALEGRGYPGQLSILKGCIRLAVRPTVGSRCCGAEHPQDREPRSTGFHVGNRRPLWARWATPSAVDLALTCSPALEWWSARPLRGFHDFGGVPQEMLCEHPKSAVRECRPDGTITFHCASWIGDPRRLHAPTLPALSSPTKGKTARTIGDVHQRFFVSSSAPHGPPCRRGSCSPTAGCSKRPTVAGMARHTSVPTSGSSASARHSHPRRPHRIMIPASSPAGAAIGLGFLRRLPLFHPLGLGWGASVAKELAGEGCPRISQPRALGGYACAGHPSPLLGERAHTPVAYAPRASHQAPHGSPVDTAVGSQAAPQGHWRQRVRSASWRSTRPWAGWDGEP
jgi:hypothetical protein